MKTCKDCGQRVGKYVGFEHHEDGETLYFCNYQHYLRWLKEQREKPR